MIKALHVLFVFIWVGNLLGLTRLMGYHTKEDSQTQLRFGRIYRRMYNLIGMPSMILAVTFGTISIMNVDLKVDGTWFHIKMVFILLMIIIDLTCGSYAKNLSEKTDQSKGVKYKILHGVTGLSLIAILVCVYVVRNPSVDFSKQNSSFDIAEGKVEKKTLL